MCDSGNEQFQQGDEDLHLMPGLSAVLKSDPQALLSRPARIRINKAYLRQQSIRDCALARIYARRSSLSSRDWQDAELEIWSEAIQQAAFTVLSVKAEEFFAVNLRDPELSGIMREDLDAATFSLELRDVDRMALSTRLFELLYEMHQNEQPISRRIDEHAARLKSYDALFEGIDSIEGEKLRKFALECADQHYSCRKEVAAAAQVHLRDLLHWIKDRGNPSLAKRRRSEKVERIENLLYDVIQSEGT
jgi:hypothetical protein